MKVKCSKCGFEFDLTTNEIEKNNFGFVKGSKGDFICQVIKSSKGIKKTAIIKKCDEKYESSSLGRVNMILYQLRKNGFLSNIDGKYFIKK